CARHSGGDYYVDYW
nr:immunoglobulin heavy chain junction region [Macaca mulatta]